MKKLICLTILLLHCALASYMVFDDTGARYLTVGDDGQTIYLWNVNGTKAASTFPFLIPEKAVLSLYPFFEDMDRDGTLDIVCTYTLDNKLYKQVIRQTGDNYDDKVYPQEVSDNAVVVAATLNPVIDERLVSLDGKAVYNTKYRWYQGAFRHSLYDLAGPTPLGVADIYSKVPTAVVSLNNTDADFDRYLVFQRQNEQTRFDLYSRIDRPTADLLVSINYPEGIYPWRFLSLDWVNNITQQDINYYYDHTPPTFAAPSQSFTYYFSPNGDGVQDVISIPVVPSDNLYYRQSGLLDIFDGPTYVVSSRTDGLTFATLNVIWNGSGSDGKIVTDATYNAQLYAADGCGNQSRIVTGQIIVDTVAPQIWEHLQNSDYFTPNGDGDLDALAVTLNLSEPATITLNIYNAFGRLVRSLSPAEGWDGIDVDGIIESGTYKFNYTVTDRAGNKTTSAWYSVYLDYRSPIIENVGPEKDAFNFKKEQFRLNLDLRETAWVKCLVYDMHGSKVATINAGTTVSTGNAVLEWDGSALADGAYMYRLLVTNRLGITGAVTGVFFNDTTLPTATFPGLRTSYAPGYITFNVALSEPVTATLTVAAETFVPTLSSLIGVTLSAGTYGLTLNAVDRAGNTCLITRNITIGAATTVSESTVATYTAVEAAIGVAVRTLHKPEPQYFNTERAVRYVVNADEFIQGLSLLSLTPKTIGQFSAAVYDVSRNAVAVLTENVAIPAGAQILTWNATGVTTGVYTLEAKLVRGTGASTCSAMVVYDTVSPTITDVRILNGQGFYTTSRRIDLYLAATDNVLPVTEMQFSADGVTWSMPEAFANAKYGFLTVTADGLQEVWAKVKDAAGNWSDPVSLSIVIDATPPRHKTIRVNGEDGGGASTINVDLQFIAEDAHGVAKMKISYNDAYSFVEYPYGVTLSYVLDPTEGLKHFFIKYTDTLGNESGIIQDTVSMDKTPPTLATMNRLTAYWTNTTNVQLQLSAVDTGMGVAKIVLSNDGFATATTLDYTPVPTLNVTLNWQIPAMETTHNIVAMFYDQAGNCGNIITASCVYDITPPLLLTENVAVDTVYLPTIRPPVRIAVTANEAARISVNILRAGQSICTLNTVASCNWSGETTSNHYVQYGSVCDVLYQVVDLAGNIGASGNTRVTLNCGYEVVSASYDLTIPSIFCASRSISVEYEDDPAGYSIYKSGYELANYESGKKYNGGITENIPTKMSFKARRLYWAVYDFWTYPVFGATTSYNIVNNTTVLFSEMTYGADVNENAGTPYLDYDGIAKPGTLSFPMSLWGGFADRCNYYIQNHLYLKYASRLDMSFNNVSNKHISTKVDRVVKSYEDIGPGVIAGDVSNNYRVFFTTTNISVSRNGHVVSILNVPSGSSVAEPSIYIGKQSQKFTGQPGVNDNVGYENIHIVWQQKNTPSDNWKIYYGVVPFYYEGLPDAQMSVITAQSVGVLAAPGIQFINPVNGDYTGTEPKVEVSVFDDDGVSTSTLTLRINSNPVTYNLSAYYTPGPGPDPTQGTLNFTLGQSGLPPLKEGKNTIYVQVFDLLGNMKEGSVSVIVRSGLFIEKVLNYPNPFEDSTTITYMLTEEAKEVKARVYDIMGRLRREINNLPTEVGYNEEEWDGRDNNGRELANDVYYLVILARDKDGDWKKARTKAVKLK